MVPWRLIQRRAAGAFASNNGITLRHLAVDTGNGVWETSPLRTGGYSPEQFSQARIIAAAPQLLEALESLSPDHPLIVEIRGIHA